MASTMIHIAVASEINKVINRDRSKLLLGSIAPDLGKILGDGKETGHFIRKQYTNIPEIDLFLKKYKYYLYDDFVLGYYIHLYTDYLWFKYFLPEVYNDDNNMITKQDGTVVKCSGKMLNMYIYNDYTNLNVALIDEYNLDLSIFYNDPPIFKNIIEEIPMDRIGVVIDKMSVIIENSKVNKDLIFNIDNVKNFINLSIELSVAKLKELKIIQ